jgi:hypothetical protein
VVGMVVENEDLDSFLSPSRAWGRGAPPSLRKISDAL